MSDNKESIDIPEIKNLESLLDRIETESSNIAIILNEVHSNFMRENFFDKKTGGFIYEPLNNDKAQELAKAIIEKLREYFAFGAIDKKEGSFNPKQLEILDAVIESYTGLTQTRLATMLVGKKPTFDLFSRFVLGTASETYQRYMGNKIQSTFQSHYMNPELRPKIINYLKGKLEKYGLELTRDILMPDEALDIFYTSIRGIPKNYEEGKNYLKKK